MHSQTNLLASTANCMQNFDERNVRLLETKHSTVLCLPEIKTITCIINKFCFVNEETLGF
jgi:hypothetical protein